MGNFITVYRRECNAYFNSPIAYILIVAFLLGMSFIFFPVLNFFGSPSPTFRAYFENFFSFCFFTLLIIPALTMRLWAEEKKQGTIELLLTLPLKTWHVVLAKFLASYTVVGVALLLTLSVPLSINSVLALDWGTVFTGYVGMFLIAGIVLALGGFTSALTENQVVGFILAVAGSGLIFFLGYPGVVSFLNDKLFGIGDFVGRFGTFTHYQNFAKGLVSFVDLVYVFSMMGLFLLLNNIVVESRKY